MAEKKKINHSLETRGCGKEGKTRREGERNERKNNNDGRTEETTRGRREQNSTHYLEFRAKTGYYARNIRDKCGEKNVMITFESRTRMKENTEETRKQEGNIITVETIERDKKGGKKKKNMVTTTTTKKKNIVKTVSQDT